MKHSFRWLKASSSKSKFLAKINIKNISMFRRKKIVKFTTLENAAYCIDVLKHGVQPRMISVDNNFVFLRLLFFALLLLYVT